MKRLLGCFLCVMLLIFGSSTGAFAIAFPSNYAYVGGTPDLTDPPLSILQNDKQPNVQWLVTNDPNNVLSSTVQALTLTELTKIEFGDGASSSGTWNSFPTPINFFSLKAGSGKSGGGFALYYIDEPGGVTSGVWDTSWNLGGKDISHITLWDTGNNPVPEPTTMLLFGAGLVGLAGFGRKKFKK
jgi:PEP-CTERM motif